MNEPVFLRHSRGLTVDEIVRSDRCGARVVAAAFAARDQHRAT